MTPRLTYRRLPILLALGIALAVAAATPGIHRACADDAAATESVAMHDAQKPCCHGHAEAAAPCGHAPAEAAHVADQAPNEAVPPLPCSDHTDRHGLLHACCGMAPVPSAPLAPTPLAESAWNAAPATELLAALAPPPVPPVPPRPTASPPPSPVPLNVLLDTFLI